MNTELAAKKSGLRFEELDALRGVAAMVVVLFHLSMWQPAFPYLRFGVMGVDLFFIISGFVIMKSLSGIRSGGEFVIKRFTRLYPAYWVCVTFTSIGILLFMRLNPEYLNDISWGKYLANMTMAHHYFHYDNIDGPYWTLVVELTFYVLMLILYWLKALKQSIWILLGLALMMFVLTRYFWTNDTEIVINHVPCLDYISLFLAGIVLYTMYVERKFYWYYYLLIALCYCLQVYSYHTTAHASVWVEHAHYKIVIGIIFALFLLFIHGKLRWLVNPVTLFFGKISYSLYLVHQFISITVIVPTMMKLGVDYWTASFAIALPVAIVLGTIVTFYVEIPAGKWLKRVLYAAFIDRKQPKSAAENG